MGGQGVVICYKEIAMTAFLHFYKILHGTEIISKVQVAGRPDSTYYDFHIRVDVFQHRAKLMRVLLSAQAASGGKISKLW